MPAATPCHVAGDRAVSLLTLSTRRASHGWIRVASQEGTWPPWSGRSAYPERFIDCDHTLPREKAHGAPEKLRSFRNGGTSNPRLTKLHLLFAGWMRGMKKCTDLASERQGITIYIPALAARAWDCRLTTDDFPFLMPCGRYGVVPRHDLPAL